MPPSARRCSPMPEAGLPPPAVARAAHRRRAPPVLALPDSRLGRRSGRRLVAAAYLGGALATAPPRRGTGPSLVAGLAVCGPGGGLGLAHATYRRSDLDRTAPCNGSVGRCWWSSRFAGLVVLRLLVAGRSRTGGRPRRHSVGPGFPRRGPAARRQPSESTGSWRPHVAGRPHRAGDRGLRRRGRGPRSFHPRRRASRCCCCRWWPLHRRPSSSRSVRGSPISRTESCTASERGARRVRCAHGAPGSRAPSPSTSCCSNSPSRSASRCRSRPPRSSRAATAGTSWPPGCPIALPTPVVLGRPRSVSVVARAGGLGRDLARRVDPVAGARQRRHHPRRPDRPRRLAARAHRGDAGPRAPSRRRGGRPGAHRARPPGGVGLAQRPTRLGPAGIVGGAATDQRRARRQSRAAHRRPPATPSAAGWSATCTTAPSSTSSPWR